MVVAEFKFYLGIVQRRELTYLTVTKGMLLTPIHGISIVINTNKQEKHKAGIWKTRDSEYAAKSMHNDTLKRGSQCNAGANSFIRHKLLLQMFVNSKIGIEFRACLSCLRAKALSCLHTTLTLDLKS